MKLTCDICKDVGLLTYIDGKIFHGPWAVMCEECHKRFGVGLGLGKGQKYVWKADQYVKL